MSSSNNVLEPSETTSLLDKNSKKQIATSINGDNGTNGDPALEDEERGSVENDENESPLLQGNDEMSGKIWLLFPAVSLGILLGSADQTLVVTMYGKIGTELNALNNTSWVASAYFLTTTSFQPLYGKMSDLFGRKPALQFAYFTFGLGCLFCGLARNLKELVAARAFAGIGAGGMNTVVSILISDIVPLRNRGIWQGYLNIVYAVGASSGAPLGGLLADSLSWRWAFIGQAPLCLLAIAIVYFVLDLPPIEDTHWREKLRKIDFLGAFSLLIAVSTLLVGLDRGSNVAWVDKITIACCCTSIPLFAIFIFIEIKIASHPFAPGHIIFARTLFPSYVCNFTTMAAFMGTIFYIPLYLQVVNDLSATSAGVRLIPSLIFSVSGSLFGGKVIQRTGKYYWFIIISLCLSITGSVIILVSSSVLNSVTGLIGGLCIISFGGGAVITITLIDVITNAGAKDQAVATACTYLFRSLGSVVGVSLGSTIMQQRLRTLLLERLGDDAERVVDGVRKSLDFIKKLDPKTREVVTECYRLSSSAAFGMTLCFVLLTLFSASWIREKKLSR